MNNWCLVGLESILCKSKEFPKVVLSLTLSDRTDKKTSFLTRNASKTERASRRPMIQQKKERKGRHRYRHGWVILFLLLFPSFCVCFVVKWTKVIQIEYYRIKTSKLFIQFLFNVSICDISWIRNKTVIIIAFPFYCPFYLIFVVFIMGFMWNLTKTNYESDKREKEKKKDKKWSILIYVYF